MTCIVFVLDCDEKLPEGYRFDDIGTVTIGSVRTYKYDCPIGTVWDGVHIVTCGAKRRWSPVENFCIGTQIMNKIYLIRFLYPGGTKSD